jgi:hypothetical protein
VCTAIRIRKKYILLKGDLINIVQKTIWKWDWALPIMSKLYLGISEKMWENQPFNVWLYVLDKSLKFDRI